MTLFLIVKSCMRNYTDARQNSPYALIVIDFVMYHISAIKSLNVATAAKNTTSGIDPIEKRP